jgi:steroid 5-alpha reductase family enzyme
MSETPRRSRPLSFALVAVAYVVAFAVAVVVFVSARDALPTTGFVGDWGPLFVADVAATAVVFAFSVMLKNHSTYDAYWSVAPIAIVLWLWLEAPTGDGLRQVVVLALVLAWGLRLTWNWAHGWAGLHHEDWRYRQIAQQTGRAFLLVSFLGIHLMPTVMVFLGCLSLRAALHSDVAFGVFDVVAAVVTAGAIAIEAVADTQMRAFLARPRDDGGDRPVMDEGLWAISRHPNYLGEILFWIGLFLFSRAAGGPTHDVVGSVAMVILFSTVSIPLMERRQASRREAYRVYQQRVPVLLPWPRRTAP